MKLFDKFKRLFKPKRPEKKVPKPKIEKPEKPIPKPLKKSKVTKIALGDASKIILTPLITEKATGLSAEDKYIFRVVKNANKPQIKRAIEALYGVKITSVNIINIPRKPRRIGRTSGFKPGYKKAVVTLAPGQKIELVKEV